MNWKNINISKNNVKAETTKAVLINMPHNSDYDGYSFWHPTKLVREGRNRNSVSIGYTDDFKFRLKKYGKGKWNSHDVIDECEISAEYFEEAFHVMDENIKAKDPKSQYETHKPNELEACEAEALDELKDE